MIDGELEAARAAGRKVEGYTYYHAQDLESVVATGTSWLAYGGRWSGTTKERIAVVGLDWRRRRFSSSPDPSPAGR